MFNSNLFTICLLLHPLCTEYVLYHMCQYTHVYLSFYNNIHQNWWNRTYVMKSAYVYILNMPMLHYKPFLCYLFVNPTVLKVSTNFDMTHNEYWWTKYVLSPYFHTLCPIPKPMVFCTVSWHTNNVNMLK